MTRTIRSRRCSRPDGSRSRCCIQDRAFNSDGSIHFTQVGDNPDIHPYWDPEYFGDTIMVNGKVWPRLKVDRRQYRFRIINALERPVLQPEAVERHVLHADRR